MQALAHRIAVLLQALHLIVAYGADVAEPLLHVIVERLGARGSRFFHRILERVGYAASIGDRAFDLEPIAVLQRPFHASAQRLQLAKRRVDREQPRIRANRLRQNLDRLRN